MQKKLTLLHNHVLSTSIQTFRTNLSGIQKSTLKEMSFSFQSPLLFLNSRREKGVSYSISLSNLGGKTAYYPKGRHKALRAKKNDSEGETNFALKGSNEGFSLRSIRNLSFFSGDNSRSSMAGGGHRGGTLSSDKSEDIKKQRVVSITYEEIGLFPRSFNRVFDRFLKQIFSDVENLVLQEYRFYRYLFLTTLKTLFLLFFVPFLVNLVAKNYLIRPLTEYFWNSKQPEIFLNAYQQKRAFTELQEFEETLFFESLISSPKQQFFSKNFSSWSPAESQLDITKQTLLVPYPVGGNKPEGFFKGKDNAPLPNKVVPSLEGDIKTSVFANQGFASPLQSMPTRSSSSADSFVEPEGRREKELQLESKYKDLQEIKPMNIYSFQVNSNTISSNYMSSKESPSPENFFYDDFLSTSKSLNSSSVDVINEKINTNINKKMDSRSDIPSYSGKVTKTKITLSTQNLDKAKEEIGNSFSSFTLPQTDVVYTSFPDGNLKQSGPNTLEQDSSNLRFEKPRTSFDLYSNSTNSGTIINSLGKTQSWSSSAAEKLQEKTIELATWYNKNSIEAITNIISDFLSFLTLIYLLISLEIQINVTKSFLLEVFFGLEDSKKSLLILLVTDLLVGYHSPNIWEFFFEFIFNHYGIPESQTVIFLLVATLPVLLDVLFKYLIFRHLNRSSPATVATYHAMIE